MPLNCIAIRILRNLIGSVLEQSQLCYCLLTQIIQHILNRLCLIKENRTRTGKWLYIHLVVGYEREYLMTHGVFIPHTAKKGFEGAVPRTTL